MKGVHIQDHHPVQLYGRNGPREKQRIVGSWVSHVFKKSVKKMK